MKEKFPSLLIAKKSEAKPKRNMNNHKGAWVVNGSRNYHHRVFAIKGARIIKSWGTDLYLSLSRSEIARQLVAW